MLVPLTRRGVDRPRLPACRFGSACTFQALPPFDSPSPHSLNLDTERIARRRSVYMKTVIPSGKDIPRNWHIIDAENLVLGRVATKAANILMGKHKPSYTPYIDMGDHIIVVNAAKVRLTGRKEEQKLYRRHSGYPGGLTETSARKVRETRPQRMVEEAISGMLPKSKLGKQMYRKLQVYAGPKHPHDAQKPMALAI